MQIGQNPRPDKALQVHTKKKYSIARLNIENHSLSKTSVVLEDRFFIQEPLSITFCNVYIIRSFNQILLIIQAKPPLGAQNITHKF